MLRASADRADMATAVGAFADLTGASAVAANRAAGLAFVEVTTRAVAFHRASAETAL